MKKILLIPTYYYLSNPIYKSMKEILSDDDFEFIYFFNKDTCSIEANLKNISSKKIGKYFDNYVELDYTPIWVERLNKDIIKEKKSIADDVNANHFIENKNSKIGKLFFICNKLINMVFDISRRIVRRIKTFYNLYISFNNYSQAMRKVIKSINPDFIVLTSDMTLSYRIIKRYFPKIKVLILQPCFLDFRDKKPRKLSISGKIANIVLNKTLYPSQAYFGLESKNDKLLLFEDKFAEFYMGKRKNIYKIFNPFFTQLNQQILDKDKSTITKMLYEGKNIDNSKPIVVMFIMDYTLSHGLDIQQYTEKAYIEIIQKYSNEFTFILKNHPRIGIKDFERNFTMYENVIFLYEQISYEDLLAIGDINISINSNASLESLVCGMTTINFLPLHLSENDHFKWLSYYCGIEVNTIQDLEFTLGKYLDNKYYFINKVTEGRRKLVGTNEACRESFLKVLQGA
ncbi:MAG: hypothetical protein RBR07_09425 [Arcobacteraceae bacterium]|nr:hypothetical protein [Arcobacteraceae bacterium]